MPRWTRRRFIRSLAQATGVAVSAPLLGRGTVLAAPSQSRVVVVQDGLAWRGDSATDADLDATVIDTMLARGLCALTDTTSTKAALSVLFPRLTEPGRRVSLKVNSVNSDLPTHPALVAALARLLCDAGALPQNLTVFDRGDAELARAGFVQDATAQPFRAHGTNRAGIGYDAAWVALSDMPTHLSRLVTELCDDLVNIPVLKQHEFAGVTLALKNHFGSVSYPELLHGKAHDACPAIAELNAAPAIRDKTRLVLIDALFASCNSGLAGRPDCAPMCLILGTDPVAADSVGQGLLNRYRQAAGLAPIDAHHIIEAADLGLGQADPSAIDQRDIVLHPPTHRPMPTAPTAQTDDKKSGCGSLTAAIPGAGLAAAWCLARAWRKARP